MPTAPSRPVLDEDEEVVPTTLPPPVETMEADAPDAAGPNLALRKQQLRQMVEQRQPTAPPQQPTLSALATPQGNAAAFRAEQQGREDAIHEQALTERETAINQRRTEVAQRKATNAQREASFRSTGQKFYTDPYGVLQPVVEAGTNRALYQPTLWEDGGKHPKTGEPTLVKRDQYGQRQYKSPPIVAGADPHDTQLYYKFAEDDLRPAGDLTAMKAHQNPQVARLARQTDARRRQAMWKEALLPMEEAKAAVDIEFDTATQRKMDLQAQIEQVTQQMGAIPEATLKAKSGGILGIGGTPTPEATAALGQKAALDQQMQALVLEQADLDEKLKPMGALGRIRRNAQLDLAIFKAKATHENYGDLAEERRDILKQQGKSEADDPILKSILAAQATYGAAVQRAAKVVEREAAVAKRQPQKFETPLSTAEEHQFQQWKAQNAAQDSGADYDLRGAFKAGATPDANGHWPDTFKKPNHPTFSEQSIYAKDAPDRAGHWDGEKFTPADRLTLQQQWAKAGPLERLKMMGGSKGFGPNEVEGAVPMIGSEAAGTKGGLLTIPKAQGTGTGAGIIDAANKFTSGLTTPENAAILAGTGGAGVLADVAAGTKVALAARAGETAAMGAFTGVMAKDTVAAVGEAKKVLADPKATDAEKADAVTSVGLAALMTGASAAGTKTLAGKTGKEFRGGAEPPATTAPTKPKPAPDPAKLDRIAQAAEAAAKLTPEQAEAEFAKLAAEFSDESKTQTQPAPTDVRGAPAEAAAEPAPAPSDTAAGDRASAATSEQPVAAAPEGAGGWVAPQKYSTVSEHLTEDEAADAITERNQSIQSTGNGRWRVVQPVAETPALDVEFEENTPVPIGARDATVSTGTGIPTAKEQAVLAEQQRLVDEHLAQQSTGEPQNALPKQSPSTPALRQAPENREAVGQGNAVHQGTAGKGEGAAVVREAVGAAPKEDRFQKMLRVAFQRASDESRGQAILDDMESVDRTPNQVVTEFWRDTYSKLPDDQKRKFEKYIERETGMKPGDVIATHATEPPIIGKTWQEIYPDSTNEVRHLEGTERGLIALMETANQIVKRIGTESAPALAEAPKRTLASIKAERAKRQASAATDFRQPVLPARTEGGKGIPEPGVSKNAPFTLSRELSGAKPRYAYGDKQFELKFDSDLDRAAYILAQKTPSKADASYLREVMTHTGLDEAGARALGTKVRERIKQMAKEGKDGDVLRIPEASKLAPPAPAPKAAEVASPAESKPRERLVAAALRDAQTGKISTGVSHGAAKDPSVNTGREAKNIGFITNTGRYVGVEEAMGLTGGAGGSEEMAFHLKDAEVFAKEVANRVAAGMPKDAAIKELRDELEKRDRLEAEGKSVGELTEWRRANGFDDDGNEIPVRRAPETKSIAAKLPEVSSAEVVTGEPISKKWTAFGPESQSLGVPRAEMPQVKSEARGALVNFLKARGIDAKAGMVAPSKLKPTQAEFSPEKVQAAREFKGSERPILISADGHVVDGHHQWMAALDDTQTPMPVIRLNAPIEKVLADMKEFPSAESAVGAAPAKEAPPAPKATVPLSDRAIAALQKAKIGKPGSGKVLSADPFTLAYDGAIDLAILGIRAGRKVAEVVKLAVDRFKARYPKHTPEELARVEAAVRSAITEPPDAAAEGSKKNSLLPESLKAAGAPVESIEYETRQQDARKQEASDIISKHGPQKAEELMVKSDLPGDTRVAIGGQLINERMLALSEAKPEEVSKIARDIQRITAKMQPELATAAGQQISMFAGIYRDVRVAAASEYIRSETKKRVDALGGHEVEKAAQEAADAFNKTKDQAAREKAIERIKEKYTTKPVRRAMDQLKRIEATKHLNDLGVLTRDDMIEAAGNALGLPGISSKKLQHLAGLADRITNAKNHAERSRAELDLAAALNVYKGVEAMDVASSLLTANILSGYTTQAANIEGNALNIVGQLASTAAVNPTKLGPLVKGFIDGLPLAKDQAKSIWQTGRGTRDFQDKTAGAGSVLSTVDFSRDFPKIPKPIGDIATTGARVVDRIFRFMKAADAVFYYPAREAYARLVATKLLEGDYRGAELSSKVSELLQTTPAAFESARRQATMEGYEGIDLGRRVADIIEERRAGDANGKMVVKESERFAAETTYTNEPEGLAGVAYHALKYAVQEGRIGKVPVLKPWVMFLKTPANVFNTTLNYTPVGAARAHFGMRGAGFRNAERRNFTKDERHRLYLQSVVGTALMGAMVARILDRDDADVSAQGPEDAAKRQQLRNAGWSPYSIRSGDKWISYKDSPLLVPLAIVGHVADSIRYNSPQKNVPLEQRVAEAVASSPQTIFQTSMLTGLADLMGALSGKGGAGVGRTLGSIPANLVIPYNRLLQQVDQSFDPQTYDNPPVVGSVPFVRRTGEPLTDVQGRPQQYSPVQRFGSRESTDAVDALVRDKQVFIPDVGRDVKLGNATMTDEQRDAYRRISGQRIRIRLQAIAPRLRVLTQEKAQDEITQIAREEREKVKPLIRAGVGVRR